MIMSLHVSGATVLRISWFHGEEIDINWLDISAAGPC